MLIALEWKEIKVRQEATPAELIAQLELARSGLLAKRFGLERKIASLEARKSKEAVSSEKCAAATGQDRR